MNGYTKLFSSLLDSTIWMESNHVRLVWVTLMAMADKRGIVSASVPGLAQRARVSLAECEEALGKFLAPDPYSRTKDHEGRRIAEVDGGWLLLNHRKYRDMLRADLKRETDTSRQRRKRERDRSALFGALVDRDGGEFCRYCGATDDLTIDHVVPRCQGGDDDTDNLVLCCSHCSSRKNGRTPEQAGLNLEPPRDVTPASRSVTPTEPEKRDVTPPGELPENGVTERDRPPPERDRPPDRRDMSRSLARAHGAGVGSGSDPDPGDPDPPDRLELAPRAGRYLADELQGRLEFQPAETWPEVAEVLATWAEVWKPVKLRGGTRDPRLRAILERFAEGYTPGNLGEAIRGSPRDPHIAEHQQFQTLQTVLRDAAQVDKFRDLAPRQRPQPTRRSAPVYEDPPDAIPCPPDVAQRLKAAGVDVPGGGP